MSTIAECDHRRAHGALITVPFVTGNQVQLVEDIKHVFDLCQELKGQFRGIGAYIPVLLMPLDPEAVQAGFRTDRELAQDPLVNDGDMREFTQGSRYVEPEAIMNPGSKTALACLRYPCWTETAVIRQVILRGLDRGDNCIDDLVPNRRCDILPRWIRSRTGIHTGFYTSG